MPAPAAYIVNIAACVPVREGIKEVGYINHAVIE
jgi:hypothetical protein